MANIQISDLYPTGSELFMDDENFMNELTDTEVNNTQGGITPTVLLTIALLIPVAAY